MTPSESNSLWEAVEAVEEALINLSLPADSDTAALADAAGWLTSSVRINVFGEDE